MSSSPLRRGRRSIEDFWSCDEGKESMKDSPEISIDQDTAVPRKTFSGRLLRDDLCESSLKLNVRFGQSKLVSLVPILCIASLLANVYFASTHRVDLAERTLHYLKPVHDSILVAEMNATSEIHVEVVTPIIFSTFMHALTTKPDGEDSKPRLAVNSSLVKSTGQIFEYERNLQRRKRKGFGIIAPQPKSLSRNATFAACLLIKDDNEILNEWIAYHYHSLNMRFLIVAVDPHSSQSPSPILDKWKLLTDLNIIEWSDDKYMPKYFLTKGHAPLKYVEKSKTLNNVDNDGMMQISNHRYRQRVFLNQCLLKSKLLGQTWTMHIDTDEYVIPSKLFRQINPDYVDPRPIQEPGSVLDLLQQVAEKTPNLVNYPCISMPRLLFGSVENKEDDGLIDSNIPAGFNATSFETIRWRNHAPPGNISYHGNPKVIVDVSAIDESYFTDEVVYSIHRPFKFCKSNVLVKFTKYYEQPIATNHYLGSWERYSGRSDNRRSQDVYTKKARVNFASDNGTQMWLKGFVKSIGRDRAVELLTGKYLLVNDPTSSINWQTISS